MPTTEITLVSDGPEVYCHFADATDPKSVDMVYMDHRELPDTPFNWKEGKNSLFRYADDPKAALDWFLTNGWQAVSEEQDWLDGNGWPT